MDENIVRRQDVRNLIIAVSNNEIGRVLAFDFIDEVWDELYDRYGAISFTLPRLIIDVTKRFNTQHDLNRVDSFIERHQNKLGVAAASFEQARETIGINIRWMNKNLETIKKWFNDHRH